jgi:hypothetical protein
LCVDGICNPINFLKKQDIFKGKLFCINFFLYFCVNYDNSKGKQSNEKKRYVIWRKDKTVKRRTVVATKAIGNGIGDRHPDVQQNRAWRP